MRAGVEQLVRAAVTAKSGMADTQKLIEDLLDKGVVIHSWSWARDRKLDMDKPDEWKNYAIRSGKRDRGAVVMAFLLLLFFQVVQIGRNEADFINALNDMFEKYTEKKWTDIDIGMPPEESIVAD